jgi:hypothetical protein
MQESKPKTKPKPRSYKYIIYIISFAILLCTGIYYNQNIILEWSGLLKENNNIQESTIPNSNLIDISPSGIKMLAAVNEEGQLTSEDSVGKPPQKLDYKLSDYHNYLLNINLLINNFFQNKIYTDQLKVIDGIVYMLPPNLQLTLSQLSSYNTKFLIDAQSMQNQVIFPQEVLLIKKFLTIEKRPKYFEEREDLRSQIIRDLEDFIIFFYSDEFQQKFIE